jgi:hypothetical protein
MTRKIAAECCQERLPFTSSSVSNLSSLKPACASSNWPDFPCIEANLNMP